MQQLLCFEFLLKRTLTLSNSEKHLLNFKGMKIRSRHRYWSDCENSFWKFKWPPILMKLVSIERSRSQCELLWRKLFHISNTRIYENRRTHEGQSETSLSPDSCIHDIANRTMQTCLEFYENFMMNRIGCARQFL